MTNSAKRPKPKFQQITESLRQELFAAKLTSAEWRFWIYLAVLDPFGDAGVEYDPAAIMVECGLSKSTYFAAKAKFQKLGWFDFKDGKTKFVNLNGCARQDSENSDSHSENSDSHSENSDSHSENSDSHIYIDRVRDQTIQTNQTDSDFFPPTPQGVEKESNFGFQIAEDSTSNSLASLKSKPEALQLTTNQSVETIVPMARQDPFFGKHRKSSDVIWDWLPDGPWKVDGKLCSSFVDAISHRWSKEYGGDVHTNKLKVQKHFRNELTNLPIEWEWYQSTYLHKAANVQIRKTHGIDTSKDEQEIIKHVAAFNPLPDEIRVTQSQSANQLIENVAPYAAPTIAQLESVATVEDDAWDAIAQQTSEWEEQQKAQIAPEGADNPRAYQNVVKQDDRDFWASLHRQKTDNVSPTQSTTPVSMAQLVVAKSMPKWDREKEKEQKRAQTRIEHWNNLLASGLPSVMADATNQALAAGYVIVDNQVVEPEF